MQPTKSLKQLRNSTTPAGVYADDIVRNLIRFLHSDEQSNETDDSQYMKGRNKVATMSGNLSPHTKKLLGLLGAGIGGGGLLAVSDVPNVLRRGYVMGKRGLPLGESIVSIAEPVPDEDVETELEGE